MDSVLGETGERPGFIRRQSKTILILLPLVNVTPEADHFDVDSPDGIVDGIDDADITDPEPIAALQVTC